MLPKLDYCNSLFYGSLMYMQQGHQKAQDSAAELMFQCRKQNHISPLLMNQRWLSSKARKEYKLTVICHSFFSRLVSYLLVKSYLSLPTQKKLTFFYSHDRNLCFHKLRTKTFAHRSFSNAAPTV